jgi:type I restriction enzyme S subunit
MASEEELQSLPNGWSIKTLGELCDEGGGDIQTGPFGSQLHSADYVSAGVPSIMPTNILVEGIQAEGIARITRQDAERLQRYRVRAGDIVYSRRGDVEKCALVTDKEDGWLCGTGCLRVRLGKTPTNPDFVHAYLSSPSVRAWVVRHSIGATMPNLNTGILKSLPVALPPPEEMRNIGTIWTALINKTNQLASMNQKLEAIARAIFKSWFVDFDPVRANADGREPEGMDAATAALFPSEFQDSELGPIPKGWSIEAIGDLTLRVSMGPFGSNIKTDNFVAEGVPIIRGKNLRDGFIDDDFVFLSDEKADELRNANAFAGDIVITHRGTLGQVGRIPEGSRFPRYVVSQSQMVLTVDSRRATSLFVYYYLSSKAGQNQLLANTSQVGVPAIARPTMSVKAIKLPLSGRIALMHAFESLIGALENRINMNSVTIRTLTDLRDTVLPRLISGKLRVLEAEKLVEALL